VSSAQESPEGGKLLRAAFHVDQQSRVGLEVDDERLETGRELDQHVTDTLLHRPARYPTIYVRQQRPTAAKQALLKAKYCPRVETR